MLDWLAKQILAGGQTGQIPKNAAFSSMREAKVRLSQWGIQKNYEHSAECGDLGELVGKPQY